jgi:hypothetical protein
MIKEFDDAKTKNRIHVNRAFGGNCYHCVADGYFDAGTAAGEEAGPERCVPEQAQAMGPVFCDVRRRQWRPIHGGL